jgi:hypothetical protein
MVASNVSYRTVSEQLLAELTAAAYQVALRHGIRGSFLDVELELWRELRAVVARPIRRPRGAGAEPSDALVGGMDIPVRGPARTGMSMPQDYAGASEYFSPGHTEGFNKAVETKEKHRQAQLAGDGF